MPLYDYRCPDCGDFRAWQRMSAAADPADCPGCARPAGRAMTAPGLALMPGNQRMAHQRNERSAHEPRVMSGDQLRRGDAGGTSVHAHHHHHHHRARGLESGLQRSHKPWSLGH